MVAELKWFMVGAGRISLGARLVPAYLVALREQKTTHIATIQTSQDNQPDLKQEVENAGMQWLWLPFNVSDLFVKNDTEKAYLQQYLFEVAQTLKSGGYVYLHCDSTCERCRLFLYALCIYLKIPASSAYTIVHSFGGDKANQLSRSELQQAASLI